MTEEMPRRPGQRRPATASAYRSRAVPAVVAQLQRALLPTTLPVLPRATIGARYQPANDGDGAGGGWFDAIALSDGTVALVVGDAAGSGTSAVAAMGKLRAVLGDQLLTRPDLNGALCKADAVAQRTPELLATTMILAQLSPAGGWLRYATCGHPPPLVIGADGGTRFLPSTGAGPLGAGPLGTGSPPLARTSAVRPGDCLLLYTVGLIQRRGSTVAQGMTELATAARSAATEQGPQPGQGGDQPAVFDPDRLCGLVDGLTERGGAYTDDVTTLAVRLRPEPASPLSLSFPADETSVRLVRRAFADWLTEIDAGAAASRTGTVVTLRHRLGRPAKLGPDIGLTSSRLPSVSFGLELDGGDAVPHARVSGEVDGGSADRLARRLLVACRGGTLPLVVDLTGVTYLASSAIRAIYQVNELLLTHQQSLTIVAPSGSAAAALLDVVGLPHAGTRSTSGGPEPRGLLCCPQ